MVRLINLTVLVLFVASAMVTVPAYAAPGGNKGDEGGGALNYVGWTTTTFTGAAGATVMNAECTAKFGAGSRWATASESFTGSPDLSEFASGAEAWVREELIGGFGYDNASRLFL